MNSSTIEIPPHLICLICHLICQHQPEWGVEFLKLLLNHPRPYIREEAITALGGYAINGGNQESRQILNEHKDTSPVVCSVIKDIFWELDNLDA